jgi:hypothetical protein
MKIETYSDELALSVKDLQEILGADDDTSCEVVATKEGVVLVRGSREDNVVQLEVHRAFIINQGVASFKFRSLCSFEGKHRGKVKIWADNPQHAYIEADGSSVKAAPGDSVPSFEDFHASEPCASFVTSELLDPVIDVVHAQSTDPWRVALRGVRIEIEVDMKLRAIATDGRRLAASYRQISRAKIPIPNFSAFLPPAAARFIIFAPHGPDITLYQRKSSIIVKTGGSLGVFRVPDTYFPKWRDCIPKDPPLRAMINASELADRLLAGIALLDTGEKELDEEGEEVEPLFAARITATGQTGIATLLIKKQSEAGDTSFTASIRCATLGMAPFEMFVNARMLADVVGLFDDNIYLYANPISTHCKQLGPFLVKFPDHPYFFEVLMPIRVA